ncbi:MAG: hypothetical protein N3A38_09225, partial [Planctomycetota bacterium]|nr:hypothetical protein [Planctomycetota bacterium]
APVVSRMARKAHFDLSLPSEKSGASRGAGGGGEGRGTPVSRLQRAAEALRRWAPAALTGGVLAASAPICAGLIAAQAISDGATVALEISAAGYTGDPAHGGDAVGGGGGAGANGWADREGSHGNDRGSQGRDDTSKESGLPDWKIEAAAEILRFDPCSSAAMKTLAVGLLEKADEAVAACRQGNAARMRDEADRLLRRALWLEPLDHAAWYVMGAAAFREGRMSEAIALMERSARAAPAWPGPAGTLAGMRLAAWVQEGRRDGRLLAEAMENLRAEVEADPDDGVRRALATCVRYGVPPSVWRKAVPAGPDALRTLASALISAGAAAEADAVVTEALGIAPPELAPEFLLLRAEAAFLRGEGDAGARGLAEFVAVVPSGRRGSVAARADAVLKKRAEAAGRLKWWEDMVRRHRTESWAHRGLGAVLLEFGRPSDAIGPLRIAAELSGDFDSLMALARAYAAAGSYGSASAVLDDAARLMPDDIGMLDLKTRVLEAQGYYPAAADVAERLAVLDAANAPGRRKDALRLRELSRRQKEGSRIAR